MKKLSANLSILGMILVVSVLLVSCGSKGSNSSNNEGTSDTPASSDGAVKAASGNLSGVVAADPADASASGKIANATVYVIGQKDTAVKTDSSGNFSMSADLKLSGIVMSSPSWFGSVFKASAVTTIFGLVVISEGDTHGRKVEFTVKDGVIDPIATIYINTVGSVSGNFTLQGQTDHTGIRVFIPGASFQATTDAKGNFTMSNVPSGTYDFIRADYPGTTYAYAIVSDVAVPSAGVAKLPDMMLLLSAGANGKVLINKDAASTSAKAVELSLATSNNAVLMMVSDKADFAGAAWEPVVATIPFTFTGDFSTGATATVNVKFSDMSGLESSPVSDSIFINTNHNATSNNATPTLDWGAYPNAATYSLVLSKNADLSNPVLTKQGIAATSYTLTTPLANTASTTYYWAVTPSDANGKAGTQSTIWNYTLDTTAPVPATTAVNNGATLVAHAAVTINLAAIDTAGTGVAAYYASESAVQPAVGAPGWTSIAPAPAAYSANMPFTCSSGNAAKTIHVWYKDAVGNISADAAVAVGLMEFDTYSIEGGGVGQTSSIAVDPSNNIHISYTANGSLKYVTRNQGAWALPEFVDSGMGIEPLYTSIATGTNNIGALGNKKYPVYISYYDTAHKQFKYAIKNKFSGSIISWGTPTVFDNYNLPYLAGTTSLCLDNQGTLLIAYKYGPYLKYATIDALGTKATETIGSVMVGGGLNMSMVSEPSGSVHIVYLNGIISADSFLWYATDNGGGWSQTVINSTPNSGSQPSIAIDSSNHLHVSHVVKNATTLLYEVYYTTNASGAWVSTSIDSKGTGTAGKWTAIAVDSSNKAHIVYQHGIEDHPSLMYATNAYGPWGTAMIDGDEATIATGVQATIAVDMLNKVHVTYRNHISGEFMYAGSK